MHTSTAPQIRQRTSPFEAFASRAAHVAGRPATFAGACTLVIGWAICGPSLHFSDTWELVINTATTILTFLMVFLIQNTQNREGAAIQLKLDELLRVTARASNSLIDAESRSEEELEKLRELLARLARAEPTEAARPTPGQEDRRREPSRP